MTNISQYDTVSFNKTDINLWVLKNLTLQNNASEKKNNIDKDIKKQEMASKTAELIRCNRHIIKKRDFQYSKDFF